jgi:GntR family transcriptional regulator
VSAPTPKGRPADSAKRKTFAQMLDKNSPIPLYYQLKTVIDERIDSGEWPPDTQVPSERELCEQFDISRITVRQALAELVSDGRLLRSHGRGTFVAHSQVKKSLLPLMGFSEEIRSRGQEPGARIIEFEETATPPPAVVHALQLGVGQKVVRLKRLRTANARAMAVETVHLPSALVPEILSENLENRSLYELLERKYKIMPVRASQQWQAVACPGADAKLLEVKKGSPVFYIQRTTFRRGDRPFEHLESFFRGDKYVFWAELRNED